MSLNAVENSGRIYAEQVKSRQAEEKASSEEREERVREDSEQQRRTSEPGRGENVDVTV
jgi:hypothetical protein